MAFATLAGDWLPGAAQARPGPGPSRTTAAPAASESGLPVPPGRTLQVTVAQALSESPSHWHRGTGPANLNESGPGGRVTVAHASEWLQLVSFSALGLAAAGRPGPAPRRSPCCPRLSQPECHHCRRQCAGAVQAWLATVNLISLRLQGRGRAAGPAVVRV